MKTTKKIAIGILFMAVMLCILAFAPTAVAAEGEPVIFATDTVYASIGNEFTTTLYLKADSDLTDFQTQYKYDTDLLTLVSATQDASLSGSMMITTDTPGVINITYTRTSGNITQQTPLVNLVFSVDENIGVGSYTLLELDEKYDNEAHTSINYDLFEIDIDTDFSELKIFPAGDVNSDGEVKIDDVTYIRLHLVQLRLLTAYQLLFADAYADNEVNIFDAMRVQQKLAKDDLRLGDRLTITFYNKDGSEYVKKSVRFQESLTRIPVVPRLDGFSNGQWSSDPDELAPVNWENIEEDMEVYAIYDKDISQAMQYYMDILTQTYYSENVLSGNMALQTDMVYQLSYSAKIYWLSTNNAIFNATTGEFTQPRNDSKVKLAATIVSYYGDQIESQETITFDYDVFGSAQVPTMFEVTAYLNSIIGTEINCDFVLPRAINDKQIQKDDVYEIRLEWEQEIDGSEIPISKVERTTSEQQINLIATATFEGEPISGDGKIYFDNVVLSEISEAEIRGHIVSQIAANMGLTLTDGMGMWNDDSVYDTTITWKSNNHDIANISNNVVSISSAAVNGISLPLTAEVTYLVNEGTDDEDTNTFALNYTMSVVTDNALLVPGVNIDAELYDALKIETETYGDLTTDHLKDRGLVYLDLRDYPDITNLSGLAYCTNLRVLNISGLHITQNMNEIATLNKLEALIMKGCGLDNLSDGGSPVLKTMINLKLLDISENNFTDFDSVFDENTRYNRLVSVFADHNNLSDISRLSVAPALGTLALSHNNLTSADLANLSGFRFLRYLSIGYNNIDSLENLSTLTNLMQLRAQGNSITAVAPLQNLTELNYLLLGDNDLSFESDIAFLNNLTKLEVLYLNDNNISSIDPLQNLVNLKAINVSNNSITSLSVLKDYTGLEEIYAENNDIASFSFVKTLTNLRFLTLANNAGEIESRINEYLEPLVNIEVLTLSGKPLRTLSFLSSMTELEHLELEGCDLPRMWPSSVTYPSNGDGTYAFSIGSFFDNIDAIHQRSDTLRFLNINNNVFDFDMHDIENYLEEDPTGMVYSGHISGVVYTNANVYPKDPSFFRELNELEVFYADNMGYEITNPSHFFGLMTKLKFVSLENCGINSAAWLSRYNKLYYVDLAGNDMINVNIGDYISQYSTETLQYLYLDNNVNGAFEDSYATFGNNILRGLSIQNMSAQTLENLPDMGDLRYLNLAGTGLTTFGGEGEINELAELDRFDNLRVLDVSDLDANIDFISTGLANSKFGDLESVYAIGGVEDPVFHKDNLQALYAIHNNGVECYLYGANDVYVPSETVEGGLILDQLPDFTTDIVVASENKISNNNPDLPAMINDFDITWTVNNSTNYEIVDGKISVKDYANIDDETLVLTASIKVYPDRPSVSRSYNIATSILRTDVSFIDMTNANMPDKSERLDEITFDIAIREQNVDGFDVPVKPVYDYIDYEYVGYDDLDAVIPYDGVADTSLEPVYTIREGSQLGYRFEIVAKVIHEIDGSPIYDWSDAFDTTIVARTYQVEFIKNSGTIKKADGTELTAVPCIEQYDENDELFAGWVFIRPGYLFGGMYLDSEFTTLFDYENEMMPSNDLTLYLKWIPHSFDVTFDANGGITPDPSTKTVLCDQPFGELPTTRKDYHNFIGWFSAEIGGYEITSESIFSEATDITVYARWELKQVQGWVSESSLPDGAQVLDQKWTYTETTTMESSDTVVDGFTRTGVERWNKVGNYSFKYADFGYKPDVHTASYFCGFDTGNWFYQNYNRSPYTAYTTTTTKREVQNVRDSWIYWHWMYDCGGANAGNRSIYYKKGTGSSSTTGNNYYYKYFSAHGDSRSFRASTSYGNRIYVDDDNNYYSYAESAGSRYWYRQPVYTCYYTDYIKIFEYVKTENKESTTQVVPSETVSNVVRLVMYREK